MTRTTATKLLTRAILARSAADADRLADDLATLFAAETTTAVHREAHVGIWRLALGLGNALTAREGHRSVALLLAGAISDHAKAHAAR